MADRIAFSGYTWALSHAAVPAILLASPEALMSNQWREIYLDGFYVSNSIQFTFSLGQANAARLTMSQPGSWIAYGLSTLPGPDASGSISMLTLYLYVSRFPGHFA
jgi:hypothetical protein